MKKNISIIIAILFPIILVGIISLAVYIPQSRIHPEYDFVFISNSYDGYYNSAPASPQVYTTYTVENGKIIENKVDNSNLKNNMGTAYPVGMAGQLYLYTVSTDTAKKVSYDEVKDLALDSNLESPDGFSLSRDYSRDFFIFGGTSGDYWVLRKGDVVKRISIPNQIYNASVLGWIKK